MGTVPFSDGTGDGTVFPAAVPIRHKRLSTVPADKRIVCLAVHQIQVRIPPKRAALVRTETTFLSAGGLYEHSATYGTSIRLGWNSLFVSGFHTTQSIFAAECGDCLFLETKAFGDGRVADSLHTHGGDMFFLLSCHVSSDLVLESGWSVVMLMFRVVIPFQHYTKLLSCDRTVQHQIPALVSLEDPVQQCPVHGILNPVCGGVVKRRIGKQLRM